MSSIATLDRVEVVRNGEVIHSATVSPDRRRASIDLPVTVDTSGWYLVRAIGPDRTFPVENTRPQAVTPTLSTSLPAAGRFAIAHQPSTSSSGSID